MGNAESKSHRYMQARERTNTEHRKVASLAMNLVREEFNRDIQEVYDLRSGELLGKGGFGTVRVVTHKETKKKFALKTIELKDVETHEQYEFLLNEIEILKQLDHPNIARVQEVFHTPDHYYMVMDLYTGGDMYARYKFRSEGDTAKIVGKLINALRYCHDRNIAHRDIKLENICFESEAEDAEVKLVDFGLSTSFKEEQLRHDLVGSWAFMAPEVLQRAHYPQACDMWSMGVVTYCLLAGYPPFRSPNRKGIQERVLHSKVQFDGDAWKAVSSTAKEFILKLLKKDPRKRLTAHQAQQHPWLSRKGVRNLKLSPEVVENLLRFKNLNLMKRVALGVVARTLEASEMQNLEEEFHKADVEGKGVISIEDFRAILARSEQIQKRDVDDIFSLVGISKARELSYTDFTAAAMSLHQLDTKRLKYAFERLDHDNNGELDYKDLLMTVGSDLTSEQVRTAIQQFDIKGNGRVTFDDFCKGMRSAGGGGALDALSTAHLTTEYMVESISNGGGVAAIKTLAEMEGIVPETLLTEIPDVAERIVPSATESIIDSNSTLIPIPGGPSLHQLVVSSSPPSHANPGGESVSSSAGTAVLSRPQSERESVCMKGPDGAAVASSGIAADATVGGGVEAPAPPKSTSGERAAAGGARAEPGILPGSTAVFPSTEMWGDGFRGSLADRRMRDSIKLRETGGLHTVMSSGMIAYSTSPATRSGPLAVAAADATGESIQRHRASNNPSLAAQSALVRSKESSLVPPLSKALGPGIQGDARGNIQAPLPLQQQHLPAPVSATSGGEPASGGQGGKNAERNGKIGVRKRVEELAADLPPKDSRAGPVDLGWGPEGVPAELLAPIDDSSGASSVGGVLRGKGPRTSEGSKSPQLRFMNVNDKTRQVRRKPKKNKRKGLSTSDFAAAGMATSAREQGIYNSEASGERRCGPGNTTGMFCLPGEDAGRFPLWLEWLGRVFGVGGEDHDDRS